MVDRAEAGIEGPWVPCFGGLSQQLGCCMAIPSKRTERVTCSREACKLHMKIMYIRYSHIYINLLDLSTYIYIRTTVNIHKIMHHHPTCIYPQLKIVYGTKEDPLLDIALMEEADAFTANCLCLLCCG